MDDKVQKELNRLLVTAARHGTAEDVTALLAQGADVNGEGWPLINAAYVGNHAVVGILLNAGADITLRSNSGKNAVEYARLMGHEALAQLIETFKHETADEIIFHRPLGDRTLQEAFNFATKERISMIRKSKYGDVEAMTREPF